jgi:hypothetical protein
MTFAELQALIAQGEGTRAANEGRPTGIVRPRTMDDLSVGFELAYADSA